MGITIFASGKIGNTSDIEPLTADVKGIAVGHGWSCHIICDDSGGVPTGRLTHEPKTGGAKIEGSLGLRGIIIETGDGAEPFSFLFDRCGVLTDMLQQVAWIESHGTSERFTSCKTQFAAIESHIRLIEVLDLLKRKYIPDLVVNDEGSYWTRRDRRLLAEERIKLGRYIRHAEKIIGSIELQADSHRDAETIADKIEEALRANDEEGNV